MQVSLLNVDAQQSTSSRNIFKVGIALFGGSCLLIMAIYNISPLLNDTSATDLLGMTTSSLRAARPMAPMNMRTLRDLPGPSPWKELTLATMEQANSCSRDVSMNANPLKSMMASMNSKDREMVVKAGATIGMKAQDLKAGVVAPLGFFDPLGISTGISQGRLLFYREAEIKHGRICMLAVLGTLVGENFHPLLGGADVSGVAHFQTVPDVALSTFWYAAFLQNLGAILYAETKSLATINVGSDYADMNQDDGPDAFSMKDDASRVPGDLGFDPLGLKPKTEADLLSVQNKEILNGRLAMIAAAGIIAQELVTGQKVFAR